MLFISTERAGVETPFSRSTWTTHREAFAFTGTIERIQRSVGRQGPPSHDRGGRGRDGCCQPPPAQIPACGFPAPGSCLRSNVIGIRGMGYPCSSDPWARCFSDMPFRRCVRDMRCNSPSPRPAAVPPPSPPPRPFGFVRGFIGTMQPSDFSSAYMPIVRLLPSWAGPDCWPDTDEISQVPTKGLHHVHMGSPTARGSSSASHLRGEDIAFRPTERRQHLEIRPVSQLHTQPVVSPVNASS